MTFIPNQGKIEPTVTQVFEGGPLNLKNVMRTSPATG